MLQSLIRWSLSNRAIVIMLAASMVAWSVYALTQLPVDVLPELTAPTVAVIADHPGLAPADMERLVTFPIESALNGTPDVRRVRSTTVTGAAVVWAEFDWGQNPYRSRQLVTERLSLVADSLPPGTGPPTLRPSTSIMGEILFIALASDSRDGVELRTVSDTRVRRRILAVPGVAQVVPIGGAPRQMEVLLSPELLRSHGVPTGEVEQALMAANSNSSAGFLTQGGRELLIRGIARLTTADSIAQTVVRAQDTVPVLVRDLGRVTTGSGLVRGAGAFNGQPAVVLGIQRQPGTNTLDLTDRIDAALEDLARSLPSGITIHADVFRQADLIETAIANLQEVLAYGAVLVVAVLAAFLANFRASLICLCAIPLSICVSVAGFQHLGLTLNCMTLGGLAIAIGELVDDALIDVENVVRRLRLNRLLAPADRLPNVEVVYRASSEIRNSITFATVIVLMVFLPVLALESVEGILLRPLAVAYMTALLASLLVALTVTPALSYIVLPGSRAVRRGREAALAGLMKAAYRPLLRWTLSRWSWVLALSVAAVALAAASSLRFGRSFLPEFHEGSLTISAVTLPGTSLAQSSKMGAALEKALLQIPEVVSTGRRTGRSERDEHLQGVESSEIDVRLALERRTKEEVLEEIRRRASLFPGMNISVGQPISHRIDHVLSGTRSAVAVKVYGEDLGTLRGLAAEIEQSMRGLPGVVDLATERQAMMPTVNVRFRRDALARHAMAAGMAARAMETAFLGTQIGVVRDGRIPVPLVIRMEGGPPRDLESIRGTLIRTPSGAFVALSSLAEVREERGPNFISREGTERKIVVSCNVTGGDVGGVVSRIRERVGANVALPPEYRVEYGGQFESQERATWRILWTGTLVIAAIFVLLLTALRSRSDALIVMCNLPLALVGGVAGVFLGGGILSLASVIGFITLFGIATRNGIMLVSHIQHLVREEGVVDRREAVIRGASERLVPILMTAATTGIALLPVGLAAGETGSEIHAPLAMVVICGLFTSTVLNMLVVPAMYHRFGSFGAGGGPRILSGRRSGR